MPYRYPSPLGLPLDMSDAIGSVPQAREGRQRPAERFVSNVLWSWLGVAVQLLPGFVVTPYMIFKLGAEQYGIWSLVFSFVGYYALVDLGFRSAAVRYAAHFHAIGQTEQINELVNTLLLYFSSVALALVALTLVIWQRADRFFHVPAGYHHTFSWLVLLAGINLSVGVVGGVFSGCVEGFQRFDVSNRIFIITFGARSIGWFVLLATGRGLVALGAWSLVTNVALVLLYGQAFERMFPALKLSTRRASVKMFRETAAYGVHTFVVGIATRVMDQITPILIGHYRPVTEVGYYNFPYRLLQYGADAVSRIGVVATPKSADMAARDQLDQVAELAILASRYCLVLFMPFALFLGTFGRPLLVAWLRNSDLALHSAPLIPIMLVGFTLAQAAQFCSSSILFGLAAQQGYAITLVVELALNVGGTVLVLPKYGILGAALITSGLMFVSRGVITPFLLCHHLKVSFRGYMTRVLAKPLATSTPFWVALIAFRRTGIVHGLPALLSVGAAATTLYLACCYFICVAPEHKVVARQWAQRVLRPGLWVSRD